MYTAIIILILVVCFLLALVVLAQNPKGGGISSQFSAGGAASMMGVKRTGDLLEKLTWGFAIGLVVLALSTHMLTGTATGPVRSINQQRALETKLPAPSAPAPGAPAPDASAPAGTNTAPATAPTTAPTQPTAPAGATK
jgi:preprotein translocase subunit SecG